MPTSPEQVDRWRKSFSEHECLEFKEAKNQFSERKLYEYCVALANEGGGHLLLGITDRPPRSVVGTRAISSPLDMAEKLLQVLGFRVDIEVVRHRDGRVLVIHIPARPQGTAYHVGGKYLMRAGRSLVPMSEDQLRAIFAEGQPAWLETYCRIGLDDQQVVELLDTQTCFELFRRPFPADRSSIMERLTHERLIDCQDGSYAIRRIGALLLARSLEDFPDVARKSPRVIVYSGTSKLETRLDQVVDRGYASGFRSLVSLVMEQLPQDELIAEGLRTQLKLAPEIVVRELVANALIHQDFMMSGSSVMVEIYSDRMEISNPGDPVVPTERFIDGYRSRNERLANVMRRMGICEEKSSGIDRVVQAAETWQLPAPEFRTTYGRTLVTVYGPRPFVRMERRDRVRACYQHCALRWVMSEVMTNRSLRHRFHLAESKAVSISQVISATIEEGLIKPDESVGGSRKFARYLPFWA